MAEADEPAAHVSDRPRLHVDLTTAWQERHRIAHGTIRVERGLVGALAAMNAPEVGFCHYMRGAAQFSAIGAPEAIAIAFADGRAEARREGRRAGRLQRLFVAGKGIERWVRDNIRAPWRAHVRARRIEQTAAPSRDNAMFSNGDTLLLPGELQRHDFAMLAHLKRRHGLRLAFVFYDLLDVLDDDDARLRNEAAFDLPSSDFIAREADVVLAISEHSRQALLAHCARRGFAPPRSRVIRLGLDMQHAPARTPSARDIAPGSFVLCVGDVTPRKNHAVLVEAWRSLAGRMPSELATLVVVGRIDPDCAGMVNAVGHDPLLAPHIRFLSNIADPALDWLYANCRFTVFPSLSEGFGLPVAESLARGKVCIASSATSLPEASQGFAIHLDPRSPADWIATIERLLSDDGALAEHVQAIAGFRPHTWADTADDVIACLTDRGGLPPRHEQPGSS